MRAGWSKPGLAVVLLFPLLLAGCGPTPGELLAYEMVLVVTGSLLGLTMWGIGYWLGRRMFGRWFVCSHCLKPHAAKVRDGDRQRCSRCGQDSTVSILDRATAQEVFAEAGMKVPRGRLFRWTVILTLVTSGVFLTASCMAEWLHADCGTLAFLPKWLIVPLLACLRMGEMTYPGLGNGFLFLSYQLIGPIATAMEKAHIPQQAMAVVAYSGIFVAVAVHWYVALRRWRWGWLLPVSLAVVNTAAAVIGYMLEVPYFK